MIDRLKRKLAKKLVEVGFRFLADEDRIILEQNWIQRHVLRMVLENMGQPKTESNIDIDKRITAAIGGHC